MRSFAVAPTKTLLVVALVSSVSMVRAGSTETNPPDSSWRNLAPKLHLQDETYADVDYIRTEITFVNYVRDPKDADIHLIITSSTTGGGGAEYTLDFKGLHAFKDISFALRHTTKADATSDEIRTALVAAIKRGLAPYIAQTGLRDRLSVDFSAPTTASAVTDPWKNWVFTISGYGFPQGEKSHSRLYYYLNGDISRVTEDAKLDFAGGSSFDWNRFLIENDTGCDTVDALKRTYSADFFYARKLSNHFSLGAELDYSNSEYNNIRLGLSASPKLEYSITRYPEYARHKVYVRFAPAVLYRQYFDTTLYDRMSDFLIQNALQVGVTATRRWGTVDLSATGSQYLHDLQDLSKNRLTLSGSGSLRIVAGLSLSISGYYELIHDQLSLRKGSATEEERLLLLHEQATGYDYYVYVGLTYTFGSIYNNIVNPIF